MHYIKFDTIESTNDFLKSYAKTKKLPDFFYVYTDKQSKGRGQQSNTWQSDCCKNILISIFLQPKLSVSQQQQLNQIVALSIIKVLEKFNILKLNIKLPNDIMSDGKKIAGILIENVIRHQTWKQSIIGIGLNVNQTEFVNLPQATSMKLISGKDYNQEDIIALLIQELKENYQQNPDILSREFERLLISQP